MFLRGVMMMNKLVLTDEEIERIYIIAGTGRDYDKAISRATVKKVFRELPWKRTVIGNERSMPEKTEIWFITDEERQEIKKALEEGI